MVKNIDLYKVLQNHQKGNTEVEQEKLLLEAYNILNGTNIKSTIREDFDYSSESNILNELTITKVLDSKRIFSINEIRKVSIEINLRTAGSFGGCRSFHFTNSRESPTGHSVSCLSELFYQI